MTQALAGYNEHGIVLATDSLATRFLPDGQPEFFNVEKLFACGEHCAVMSGGAGVSVPLSLAWRHQLIRRQGLLDPEEMVEFSLNFLTRGYAGYLEKHGPEPEGFRRVYFILAGYFPEAPPPGYRLYLMGSEENELPLRLIPVSNVVVMPRNLSMEMRLFKALAAQRPFSEILQMSRKFLEKQAELKEEVGPPFYFATITTEGYQPQAFSP